VNNDLMNRGVKFVMETSGKQLIDWADIKSDDIVIIPAFGTTLETESILKEKNIDTVKFNTTCPFVEKVWNRSEQIGEMGFTIIIHGKHYHEETRATFSHSVTNAASVIVRDFEETKILGDIIFGKIPSKDFYKIFDNKYSENFDVEKDLQKIGVVNQTTMLATETQEIADHLRSVMSKKFGEENIKDHFADTRDTLCYATNDNQEATYGLLKKDADFAIVVGGYNSSNTGHIVELCKQKLKTFFISGEDKIISKEEIKHYNLKRGEETITKNYLPDKKPVDIILTSGASCPDAIVDQVLQKVLSFFLDAKSQEEVLKSVLQKQESLNN
jgi:4-hydroxy-3-methylbut-2-en-1-yl diphosphate reductase